MKKMKMAETGSALSLQRTETCTHEVSAVRETNDNQHEKTVEAVVPQVIYLIRV